jgi:hypothetical protein
MLHEDWDEEMLSRTGKGCVATMIRKTPQRSRVEETNMQSSLRLNCCNSHLSKAVRSQSNGRFPGVLRYQHNMQRQLEKAKEDSESFALQETTINPKLKALPHTLFVDV